MIDKRVPDLARRTLDGKLRLQNIELDREIQEIYGQMRARGLVTGKMIQQISDAVCQDLRSRTYLAWDVLQSVLSETGSRLEEQPSSDLISWIENIINEEFERLSRRLQESENFLDNGGSIIPLQEETSALKEEFRTKAELLAIRRKSENSPIISNDDSIFIRKAIDISKKARSRSGKIGPKVGVVVVKEGKELAGAHRGQMDNPEDHAEFIALETILPDEILAGATVYTTLEPCTSRNHPKVPCAQRLVERKVARVVIGMLDPNPVVCGKGVQLLRNHNIHTALFPPELAAEAEELNREFRHDIESRVMDGAFLACPVESRNLLPPMADWPPAQQATDILIIGINLNLVLRQADFFKEKILREARIRLVMVDPRDQRLLEVLRRGVVEQQHVEPDFKASLATIKELYRIAPVGGKGLVDLRVIDYVPTMSFQVLDGNTEHGCILAELAPNKIAVPERPHFVLRADNNAQKEWYQRFLENCSKIYSDATPWTWE
jgi:pyrimidine deaminase RibD-like protein